MWLSNGMQFTRTFPWFFWENHVPKWQECFRKSLDPGPLVKAPFSTYLRQVIYSTSLPAPWKLHFPAALEWCGRMDLGTYWAIESCVEMREEEVHSMWKLNSPMLCNVMWQSMTVSDAKAGSVWADGYRIFSTTFAKRALRDKNVSVFWGAWLFVRLQRDNLKRPHVLAPIRKGVIFILQQLRSLQQWLVLTVLKLVCDIRKMETKCWSLLIYTDQHLR